LEVVSDVVEVSGVVVESGVVEVAWLIADCVHVQLPRLNLST
jgi:hypothetical protein